MWRSSSVFRARWTSQSDHESDGAETVVTLKM
jgi:hypothetical protein